MKFVSTRGQSDALTFAQALLQGIAPDGGLYYPTEIPRVSLELRASFADKKYHEIAADILSLFGDDFAREDIDRVCQESYDATEWSSDEIAPVHTLSNGLHLLELFHGPTGAFKDFALQLLPRLMDLAIQNMDSEERCILVATSGDTGGAALKGFADVPATSCVVFFPKGGVSPLQQAQMQSAEGDNLITIEVSGDFDAAQSNLKAIFADQDFAKLVHDETGILLSSANSINIGRLLPQAVYAFAAHAKMVQKGILGFDDSLDVAVPTGNFGDLFATYLAKQMGLPIGHMTCASNANNTSAELMETGQFDIRGRSTQGTISPAMDILRASNLERLLYSLSGGNAEMIRELQSQLIDGSYFELSAETFDALQAEFSGVTVTDDATLDQMQKVYSETGYLPDPHTAIAIVAAKKKKAKNPVLIYSTAHFAKFSDAAFAAVSGDTPQPNSEKETLQALSEKVSEPQVNDHFLAVLDAERIYTQNIPGDKASMQAAILEFLHSKKQKKSE